MTTDDYSLNKILNKILNKNYSYLDKSYDYYVKYFTDINDTGEVKCYFHQIYFDKKYKNNFCDNICNILIRSKFQNQTNSLKFFFMLYQCINLKFINIEFFSKKKYILINLYYKNIIISIQIYRTQYFKIYFYYCKKTHNLDKILPSSKYDGKINFNNDNSIIGIETEFSKNLLWYKRLLILWMRSDYAKPNLLNLIPEDVSRYIISQYL